MQGLFFALGLALLLLTLPGTLELLLVTLPALLWRSQPVAGRGENIRLAVVTPAHNEARDLPATLASLQRCRNPIPPQDHIVIADNCTDDTAGIARAAGCTVLEREDAVRRGKGYALNYAFSTLAGKGYDAVVIVDADTRVDSGFLDAIRAHFANGADAIQTGYRVGNPEAGFRPRLMHIAFLAFNFLRPLSRKQAGFSSGILGNGFGLSMATLDEVPYDSFSIVEDLEYHIRLVRAGRLVEFVPEVSVWSDMPVSAAEAQSQRERWEGGRFRMVLEQAPRLFRGVFRERRLALLEPLLELLLMPLSYHLGALLLVFVIGLWLAHSPLLTGYGLFGLALVAAHVVIAMLVGGASREDWKTLLRAPFYMAWKFARLSSILKAAGRNAEWKRTSRGD